MLQRHRFYNGEGDGRLHSHSLVRGPLLTLFAFGMLSQLAFSQTPMALSQVHSPGDDYIALNTDYLATPITNAPWPSDTPDDPQTPAPNQPQGAMRRGITRILRDQKQLYSAPFERSNLKWDFVVLAGTGALIATDRHIESHLPGGNVAIYTNVSNAAIGGTAATLSLLWGYGLKTHNEHLKELGSLEIEALVNTFLIYTPTQIVAGRDRPGEGNGYGDFWRHHSINTSFPAGHPMFTLAMASVVAHEYPKPWVKVLAYSAGAAVMGGRLLGRDHWSSDVFAGAALGYFIGSRIFHVHCNPMFSEACHSR